jgi:hypothetical protein
VGNFVFFAFLNNDDRFSIRSGDISMREPTGIFVGGDVFFSLFMPVISVSRDLFAIQSHTGAPTIRAAGNLAPYGVEAGYY